MSVYPEYIPNPTDIDAMTRYGGNYWSAPGFTDDIKPNIIGLFIGITEGSPQLVLWHSFYLDDSFTSIDSG